MWCRYHVVFTFNSLQLYRYLFSGPDKAGMCQGYMLWKCDNNCDMKYYVIYSKMSWPIYDLKQGPFTSSVMSLICSYFHINLNSILPAPSTSTASVYTKNRQPVRQNWCKMQMSDVATHLGSHFVQHENGYWIIYIVQPQLLHKKK